MTTAAVTSGDQALGVLADHADAIDHHAKAFCQRTDWLLRAARLLPGEPLVVSVHDDAGDLVALIAAQFERRFGVTRIESLGGDLNDYAPAFAATPGAAHWAAAALSDWTQTQRLWLMELDQIDDAALATELVAQMGAVSTEGSAMPRILDVGGFTPSKGARKANNKTTNRLKADGRDWSFDRFGTETPGSVIDSVVSLRRTRDHASGRRSHLDDPDRRCFYVETLQDLLHDGQAAIHTLTVDDTLAGYAVSLHDHDVHRMWDGRVAVGYERYRAGTACTWFALHDAKDDPSVATLDWLRGINPEKIHNDVVTLPCLRATSHRPVDWMDRWAGRARAALKSLVPTRVRSLLISRS